MINDENVDDIYEKCKKSLVEEKECIKKKKI